MEKKTYWVAVQTPVSETVGYYQKAVNAPSMERAKEIVARYCDYHNKRCGFSGDKILRVVPTSTSYAIKILYNPDSTSFYLLNALFDKLGRIKSVYAPTACFRYKVTEDNTQALFLLDGDDTSHGDVTLKEVFAEVLEPFKTNKALIDYSIEAYSYNPSFGGAKIKNFMMFKRA